MRPTLILLLFPLLLALAGCGVPLEAKRQAVLNEAVWSAFVVKVDAGSTTRDQEQAFIRAEAKNATAMRAALGAVAGEAQ